MIHFCDHPTAPHWSTIYNTSKHYSDVIMSAMSSQITSLTIVTQPFIQVQIKKTSKLRVTGLCVRNSPVTGEFPAQRAGYARNISTWWRHHECKGMRWIATYMYLLRVAMDALVMFHDLTLNNGKCPYFRFDEYNKTKYTYSHNNHTRNG